MSTKIQCECGAATEGRWADKHHPECAVIRAEKLAGEIEAKTSDLERLNYKSAGQTWKR